MNRVLIPARGQHQPRRADPQTSSRWCEPDARSETHRRFAARQAVRGRHGTQRLAGGVVLPLTGVDGVLWEPQGLQCCVAVFGGLRAHRTGAFVAEGMPVANQKPRPSPDSEQVFAPPDSTDGCKRGLREPQAVVIVSATDRTRRVRAGVRRRVPRRGQPSRQRLSAQAVTLPAGCCRLVLLCGA